MMWGGERAVPEPPLRVVNGVGLNSVEAFNSHRNDRLCRWVWRLVLEEDEVYVFDVGVGGEAPNADVAAAEVAVGVPVGGDGGAFVVYFFPIAQEL